MTAKTVVTLGPWNNYGSFCQAQLKVNNIRVYDIIVNTRTPQPGQWTPKERRCHTNRAAQISCYIGGLWQASRSWPLKATAVMLAEMGASPNDLEAFFKAAADMEWEEALILEARRAADALVGAPESPAYLVIRLLSGVLEYEYLPMMAEAQQAVADHCGVETTDLQSTAGIPWGAVFSATNGDKYDAWAFPVHDSGENIANLSAQVEIISQHRWQLWGAFHTAAARLRVHGLEVPEPLSDIEDEPVADKSALRRLAVQIPEEMQPGFLATTFDLAVLRAAHAIAEQNKEEEEEES